MYLEKYKMGDWSHYGSLRSNELSNPSLERLRFLPRNLSLLKRDELLPPTFTIFKFADEMEGLHLEIFAVACLKSTYIKIHSSPTDGTTM